MMIAKKFVINFYRIINILLISVQNNNFYCMGCVSNRKDYKVSPNGTETVKPSIQMNEKQCRLLKLIYSDLASRSAKGEVTIENFMLFFHKNGFWGERLFKEFDTGKSNSITQQQFIKGMGKNYKDILVRIFKTTEDKKIQLLFKFFSDYSPQDGITLGDFLKMLYNYPKEQLKNILNDQDFVNNQIKNCLVGIDSQVKDRRLESLMPGDMMNNAINGKSFRYVQKQSNSQRRESKYGDRLIEQLSKTMNQKKTSVKIKVGKNDVQIKTTSIHHLVKKYARSIFRNYNINQKTGSMNFGQFKDWVINHKELYNDYYSGFHCETWEIDKSTNKPLFTNGQLEYSTKAQFYDNNGHCINVTISLIHSILIICNESNNSEPIMIICLQGLAANPMFDNQRGYGIQLTHRDGVYQPKKFFLLNQQIQINWMEYLKFFKGASINQIYQMKQQIGTGKFSVVYHGLQKSTGQSYAIKVIQSYKLDNEAKQIIAHESSIMSIMSHPLLVFFKQTITTKTHIYIITQLVRGKDLFDLVKELKHLDEMEASYILQQIIIGVRYIHSLGIAHRDLKPQNIMLQYDEKTQTIGRVKIIDFGFANYLNNLRNLPIQQLWAGTPNYIAPEILRKKNFSQKIDNFAIGSILYFVLSGTLPFNSNSTQTILQKTVDGEYSIDGKKWQNITDQAKDLVTKLLENEPQDRITLDEALRHPWFQMYRQKRENKTSIKINHIIEQRKKSASSISSSKLIY